jgi:hypothetical protein
MTDSLLTALAVTLFAAEPVDFQRDVRPILSAKCFLCHGPAEENRAGELRLDLSAEATKDRDGRRAIVPGKPAESELVQRITAADPDVRMPPAESKKTLSPREIELLTRWIEQGAAYADHWAYLPPQRPALPQVQRGDWVRNEIDRFILARIEAAGLTPSPPAERSTWLRRVSLDLIGLPPSPEELRAYLQDNSPQADERVVDRLLTSPRFGERWAQPWLDLARYADSNGYQADQLRDSWAYRDWVINALNADMPFDRFTIEQLAGDLLADATFDQKVATGFHRATTCNVEAGVHPEENRTNQIIDRVNTTATVWLGLTLECCQCHDHKYDPLTQRDYYQVFAYFNNTPLEVRNPSGQGVAFDFFGPKMDLPLPATLQSERIALQERCEELEGEKSQMLALLTSDRDARLKELLDRLDEPPAWQTLSIAEFASTGGEEHRQLDDGSILVSGRVPGITTYTVTVKTTLPIIAGFKLEALSHPDLPGMGPGRGDARRPNFILSEFGVTAQTPDVDNPRDLPIASAEADYEQARYPVSAAFDDDLKTGWAIGQQFGKSHWAVFHLRKPLTGDGEKTLVFTLDQNYGTGRTIGCLKLSALTGRTGGPAVPDDIAKILHAKRRTKKDEQRLDEFLAQSDPRFSQIDKELAQMKQRLARMQPPSTLVMVEMDQTRDTHMLQRGNYLTPGEKVAPGTPAVLHPLDPALPSNRLGFAQWLVSRDNPLTARVTVNRWWAELFGQGIVTTVEDFGLQSEPPTHPELLDWLAVELVEASRERERPVLNGAPNEDTGRLRSRLADEPWSMKRMLKLIALSATYRQASRLTPELAERDPENKLYARAPRFRLSAETIRDQALAASGLLSSKMGGPPIMPHQPTNIWKAVGRNAPKWVEANNEDRFRRGVYVVWRRAAPYPSFVNFDAPDRAACTVNRSRTNTPLQALTLLNDPAYVEMALALAARVLAEKPAADLDERIDHAVRVVLARPATSTERAELRRLWDTRRKSWSDRPQDVERLLKSASVVKLPDDADPLDVTAWFHVMNLLLNLDETITKG